MADKLDGSGFLHRWSVRKAEARNGVLAPEPEDAKAEVQSPADEPAPEVEAEPAPDLPDVETLDASSDYTAFLGKNVPQDVANLAFRKLWRSDPVLANLDGLNDYDQDYSKVGMVSEVVKTLYQVGKGFITSDDAVRDAPPIEDGLEERLADETPELESPTEENAAICCDDHLNNPDKVTPSDGQGEG